MSLKPTTLNPDRPSTLNRVIWPLIVHLAGLGNSTGIPKLNSKISGALNYVMLKNMQPNACAEATRSADNFTLKANESEQISVDNPDGRRKMTIE